MFSSKELGDCNPRTQRNAPTSPNAGYAHGCHHTSLLVLATTRRHAICITLPVTRVHPPKISLNVPMQSELNSLIPAAASASSGPPQNLRGPPAATALHPTHSSTQPPAPSRPTITQPYSYAHPA